MKPEDSEADVIVIGGGVAGLAAARALAKRRRRVVLLEARDRLGGRIFTRRPKGWPEPFELGAQFVHAGNADIWRLLREARIRVSKVPNLHYLAQRGSMSQIRDLDRRIFSVTRLITERGAGNLSFADYFRRHPHPVPPANWNLAKGFVEGFEAAPMEKISARSLAGAQMDEEEQFMVPGGYDQVVSFLVSECLRLGVTMMTSTVVRSVTWRKGNVVVGTWDVLLKKAHELESDVAVVTLPLGVLQARSGKGAVSFRPSLAGKKKVLSKMGMGRVYRIALRLSPTGWKRVLSKVGPKRGPLGFVHSSGVRLPTWWSLKAGTSIVGWAGGPDATALMGLTPGERLSAAIRSLAAVLGIPLSGIIRAVTASEEWDWNNDPYSRGAYSFIAAGQDNASRELAKPVKGTLFFAGEATADGIETGTVHGAFSSGLRAARQVLAAKVKPHGSF